MKRSLLAGFGFCILAGLGFFLAYENVRGQTQGRPIANQGGTMATHGPNAYWGCLGYCNGPLRPAGNYYTCFGYCPSGANRVGPWTPYSIYAAAAAAAAGPNAGNLFPFPAQTQTQPQPPAPPTPPADPKEVERLTRQLQEKDKDKRMQAAHELALRKAREAAKPLMQMLNDPDPQVRTHAAQALAFLGGDAVGDVTQGLYSEDRLIRMGSALALGMMGEKANAALTALKGSLKDVDVRVRGHAAQAIYRISKDAAVALPVLLECLKDEDEHVRLGVIHALGMMGKDARPAMDGLKKSLQDHAAWIRLAACGALWEIAPDPKEELAKQLLPVLAELLQNDHGDIRAEVVGLLAQMKGNRGATDLLQKAARDSSAAVGQVATHALAQKGNEALDALIQGLSDRNAQVRFRSVMAIARMEEDATKAIPALIGALRDKDVGVRWEAALALGRMKAAAKEAVSPLTEALEDPAYQVRMMAAEALGEIGPEASAALTALNAALKDPRGEVVDSARLAIRKISKK